MLFRDLEGGRPMFVEPGTARAGYLERFAEHRQQLHAICLDLGVDLAQMLTDQPLDQALYHWLGYQIRRTSAGAERRRPGREARST
jgi:hypothetical protein